MLIENWHYFEHQIIEFGRINLLTGGNSSGKSTIIDAMQVVLMGETNGSSFNKAANGKSNRTLKSYLMGELGADADGSKKALRLGEQFTTQLVCEFRNDDNYADRFCLGALFDVEVNGDIHNTFFILRDRFDERDYADGDVPRNIEQFKKYCSSKYGANNQEKIRFYDSHNGYSNKQYKKSILSEYNVYNDKMFDLLKKSISFKNVDSLEEFISKNICDEKNKIVIEDMKTNFSEYRKQRENAERVEQQLDILKKINESYDSYAAKRDNKLCYEIAGKYAEVEKIKKDIDNKYAELKNDGKELERLNNDIEVINVNLERENSALDELKIKKEQCKENKREKELSEKIKQCNENIANNENEINSTKNRLKHKSDNLSKALNEIGAVIDKNSDFFTKYDGIFAFEKRLHQQEKQFKELSGISDDTLNNYSVEFFDTLKHECNETETLREEYRSVFKSEAEDKNVLIQNTKEELKNLEKGIKSYDKELIILRDELRKRISQKYNKQISVDILSDLLEIDSKFENWHNTIEGYLNTLRFSLIIEPEYFEDAYFIYKELRNKYPISKYKIVDCEKVLAKGYKAEDNSLAGIVLTDNVYAKAYINYVLGRVKMCKNDSEIRKYNIGVTDSGMLYQGYTVGTINQKLWETHFIGKASIQQQIEKKRALLKEIEPITEVLNLLIDKLMVLKDKFFVNEEFVDGKIVKMYKAMEEVAVNQQLRNQCIKERDSIDLTIVKRYDEKIEQKEFDIKELKDEWANDNQKIGAVKSKISERKDDLPKLEENCNSLKVLINTDYDQNSVMRGEELFRALLDNKGTVEKVFGECGKNITRLDKEISDLSKDIFLQKRDYNSQFDISLKIADDDNTEFEKEYNEKNSNLISEYIDKMKEAEKNSYIQFQNDFMDKIKDNILSAKAQLKEVNRALKDKMFGNACYEFKAPANKQYQEYYDMIMEERGAGTLFEYQFTEKYKEVFDDLFKKIVGSSNGEYGEMEDTVLKFTDYRTYLDFQLWVTDDTGIKQNLAESIRSKSGGETQTPFYISFMASFAQIYKTSIISNKPELTNTARFIIFDEAFNNMDDVRIRESVDLLRDLHLQAIICAPTPKITELAPKADNTLLVYREGHDVNVIPWEKRDNIDITK